MMDSANAPELATLLSRPKQTAVVSGELGTGLETTPQLPVAGLSRGTTLTSLASEGPAVGGIGGEAADAFYAKFVKHQMAEAIASPANSSKVVAAARGLLALGKATEARRLLTEAKTHGEEYWLDHLLAIALWNDADKATAYELLTKLARSRPNDFRPLHALARLRIMDNDLRQAAEHLKEASRLRDAPAEVFSDLGAVTIVLGDRERAIGHLRAALAKNHKQSLALNNLGICYAALGKTKAAYRYFSEAVHWDPHCQGAVHNLCEILVKEKKYAEVTEILESHVKRFPRDFDAMELLAFANVKVERLRSAEGLLQRMLAIQPNDAGSLHNLGIVLAARGNQHGALMAFEKALECDPVDPTILTNIAHFLGLIGKGRRALHVLPEEMASQSPAATVVRTKALVEEGLVDEALLELRRTVERFPKASELVMAISYILISIKNEPARSVEYLERGHRLEPSHLGLVNNLGYAYIRIGELHKARQLLMRYLERAESERSSAATCLLASWGLARMREGAFSEGVAFYREAISRAEGRLKERLGQKLAVEEARDLANRGAYTGAAKKLERVLSSSPNPEIQAEAREVLAMGRTVN